jgi:hypothetical protein
MSQRRFFFNSEKTITYICHNVVVFVKILFSAEKSYAFRAARRIAAGADAAWVTTAMVRIFASFPSEGKHYRFL